MKKFLIFIILTLYSNCLYANQFTLNCNMSNYGNTTNESVAKSWVNPTTKFVVNGNQATFYYSNQTLSGSSQDKGDRLKMYFSRTVTMKSGNGSKKVNANLVIDYFYESQKIAADWRFVGFRDLGTVWGKCTRD